jgi:hypothetical protein
MLKISPIFPDFLNNNKNNTKDQLYKPPKTNTSNTKNRKKLKEVLFQVHQKIKNNLSNI